MDISFVVDTNILIQFEEPGPDGRIREQFQRLHALLIENKIYFQYHPASVEDLEKDTHDSRRNEMLSRIKKYPSLESPPTASGDELERLFGAIKKKNDIIDCHILFSIKRNCATYLITEDEGIHKRARLSNLNERVFYVHEAISILTRQFKPEKIELPLVTHEFVYNLDLDDSFFDSLKIDYPPTLKTEGFIPWFKSCAEKKRQCWTIRVGDDLAGVCIYKYDSKQEHGFKTPSVKLCTFKVAPKYEGLKYGELLLKMAINHAAINKVETLWVTTLQKQDKLIDFLKRFGFQVHSELKGEELIFFKMMNPPNDLPIMDPLDFHIRYCPHFYDDESIKKFVIPIQSKFHDSLFPEMAQQLSLGGISQNSITPGNTIRKVYLSHANIKELPAGSIVFFYRSAPAQHITTVGIVESSRRLTDVESLAAAIGKRSVYSNAEVKKMVEKEVLVINFRLANHFEPGAHFSTLSKSGILNGPPQTVMELPHDRYLKLKALLLT